MKKGLILSIIGLLILSLVAGCSSSTSSSKDEIRLGFYGPLTGPTSQAGTALRNGAKLAVEEINSKGGVNGKQITLIEYDDKSSPEQAVKAVTRMVEVDKVHGIVGSLHSGNILASGPINEKAQVPEIGAGTSPGWLQQGYKYLFRSLPNSSWEILN